MRSSDAAMVAQAPDLLRQLSVRRHDGASIAESPQVLPRVEAEAAHAAERPGPPAAPGRALSLRRIFDEQETGPLRGPAERIHVRHLAVEMHHDQRTSPRRDGFLDG